ncbi:MAG: hypothetical protein HFG73_01580 [Hungatella sp.]|nr:hypothetical protein [Hungatella sp.]
MAKKTNKTSHVMDLLTNGAEMEEPVNDSAAPVQEQKSDVQSHTVSPAKVTVVDEGSRNDRLSQEILGKLTEELEEENKQDQEASDSAGSLPADESAPEKEAGEAALEESVSQALGSSEPEAEAAQVPSDALEAVSETSEPEQPEEPWQPSIEAVSEPVQPQEEVKESEPEPQPAPVSKKEPHPIIPESQMSQRVQNKEYRFVNVMEQLLMRQDLDTVLKQHGVCTCPRCMSDVCALALTGLPSKYVVTSKDSISPLLSYYENKYKIPVLTELMKACDKVRHNPRHKNV